MPDDSNQVIKTAVEKAGILNKRLAELFDNDGEEPLNGFNETNYLRCIFYGNRVNDGQPHLMVCRWQQAKLAFEDIQKFSGLFEG